MAGALSLWLVPDDVARARLQAAIAETAARAGTPPFPAHLTLLGGIRLDEPEALERTRALAGRLRPVPLRLPRAGHEAEYFRCVFLEAEPTADLLGAHQRARVAIGRGPDRYRPHLSLVYGRLPEARRAELAGEAERALEVPVAATAARLELWRTAGAVSRWRACGAFDLAG